MHKLMYKFWILRRLKRMNSVKLLSYYVKNPIILNTVCLVIAVHFFQITKLRFVCLVIWTALIYAYWIEHR